MTPLPHDSPVPPSPGHAPLEAVLAAQDWADLSRRLTKYAYFRLGKTSWDEAEEVAQEAVVHVLDPAYAAWDRARHPDLFDCLGHHVNGIVANRRRLLRNRAKHVLLRDDERVHDDELELNDEETASTPNHPKGEESEVLVPREDGVLLTDARTPHELTTDANAEIAIATLRVRLAADALCLGLLGLIQRGIGGAAEQARELGVKVTDVYTANRRLNHHARRVGIDLAKGGES